MPSPPSPRCLRSWFTVVLDRDLLPENVVIFIGIKTGNIREVVSELVKIKELREIYVTSGSKNIVCVAWVKDASEFKRLMEKINRFKVNADSNIVLETIKEEWDMDTACITPV